jgi:hypothetical protein
MATRQAAMTSTRASANSAAQRIAFRFITSSSSFGPRMRMRLNEVKCLDEYLRPAAWRGFRFHGRVGTGHDLPNAK